MMKNKTLTNKIEVTINYDSLLKQYTIYKIKNNSTQAKDYKKFYKDVKDSIQPLAHVVDGRYMLLALPENRSIDKLDTKYDVKNLKYAEIQREKKNVIINLINSLLAQKSNYFKVDSDPYGLYYLVESKANKLIAIKIYVDKNMYLSLNVAIFIKSKSKTNKEKYILKSNKVIRALDDKEDGNYYVKGNYMNSKSTYPFFGLQLNYKESKVYVLSKYIESLHHYFKDIITVKFEEVDMKLYDDASDIQHRKEELKNKVISFIEESLSINIVNYTDLALNNDIELLRKNIRLYTNSDIDIFTSYATINDGINITITMDKEFYEKNNIKDPYKDIKLSPALTQNITIEILKKLIIPDSKLIHALLKEIAIKDEVISKSVKLPYVEVPDGFVFIYPKKDDKVYSFYKVSFTNCTMLFDELTSSEKRVCNEISMSIDKSRHLEAIVIYGKNINYIEKTNGYALPLFQEIDSLLLEYEKTIYLKAETIIEIWDDVYNGTLNDKKNELLKLIATKQNIKNNEVNILELNISKVQKFKNALANHVGKTVTFNLRKNKYRYIINSLIGIRYKEYDSYSKYIVGSEKNIAKTLPRANPIREIRVYRGKLLANNILGMLSEYFVKNGEFTVLPYPLKYIREYYKINN